MVRSKLFVGSLVAATSLSAFILSSTTVSAETYTRSALVRVQSACTLSGAVATAHTANVSIGTYRSDIGETVLSAVCNDAGGFGIYAIGYTGDTDGNNKLVNSTDSTVFINTGLAESGNTSAWAMKLTAVENAATPTILNDYDDYNVVPNDYVKVASYPSTTTASASSMFKTYYAAYISVSQSAGTYNGKVKYVMVHPANGAAPEKESGGEDPLDDDPDITNNTNHPCMNMGDASCQDTDDDGVPDSLVFPANSLLRAYEIAYTNAGKPMYIEDANTTIGWRPMVASDYATVGGKEVRFAIQDIEMTLDGTANGTKVCAAADSSTYNNSYMDTALVMDLRDGTSYRIVKAADGRCWLQDNLALDLTNNTVLGNLSTANTNANANSLTALRSGNRSMGDNYATAGVANWTSSYSWSVPLVNASSKNLSRTDLSEPDDPLTEANGWKFGVYYNYCAASAGSYCYGNGTEGEPAEDKQGEIDTESDICPSGWRMPTSSEFVDVFSSYADHLPGDDIYPTFRNALRVPLSGGYYNDHTYAQGNTGYFWSTTFSYNYTMTMEVYNDWDIGPSQYDEDKFGITIRCINQNGIEPARS